MQSIFPLKTYLVDENNSQNNGMFLLTDIRFVIKRNIWIPISFLVAGIILLKFSDSAALVKLIRLVLPSITYNFVENTMVIGGLISLGFSFYAFAVWIKAANEKRAAQRKTGLNRIAQTMGWNYSEYLTSDLRPHVESFLVNRALVIPAHSRIGGQNTAHFLSTKIDNDLIIIFDCVILVINSQGDSSTSFETVHLVVSEKLNLPYFQTQPETWLGDNALASYFKEKAGINDLNFPDRPVFSQKYIVDIDPLNAPQVFAPAVLDFYEQNQLPHIIGDGKMLALITWQEHPITQDRITANLQILQHLFQLLRKS